MGEGPGVRALFGAPTTSRTYPSIPLRNPARSASLRWMRWRWASHWPVMAGLLTCGWTTWISRTPLSVATSALPWRSTYCRRSRVSMISARVAGVPSPEPFIASESSRSSSVRPAVSMAVSSVASVKRFGGRVFLATARASSTCWRCPGARPGGRSWGSSASSFSSSASAFFSWPSSLAAAFRFSFSVTMSSTFQPACSTIVPVLW